VPKVAVAVPVYNGERYLEASLASLLAQTFGDFELLILDNASTDGSEKISRAFAARDARVRYHRNPQNIGGGPNWNLAFDLASPAPYFKWAAHDDVHAPRFLERCVAALDADPGAVLAFTGANRIDPDGKLIGPRTLEIPLGSPDRMSRFFPLLESYDCLEIHAVMRRDALLKLGKPVLGMHLDGDGVMLIRLALLGRFHLVDECLFSYRSHEAQTVSRFDKDYEAWVRWWDPSQAGRRVFPHWRRQLELWRAVLATPYPLSERVRCAVALAKWIKWNPERYVKEAKKNGREIWESLLAPLKPLK
jgi:glycosyltransferase involved in cell wall biosynthesis